MFPNRALRCVCLVLLAIFVHVPAFAQMPPPGAVRQIALGRSHACAITQESALYCWGENKFGQVGNGNAGTDVAAPALIFPDGVTAVSAGWDETCAIVRGALWCWGDNVDDRVGAGPGLGKYVDKPTLVFPKDATFVTISKDSAELEHSCAIVAGALRCWGWAYGNKPVDVIHAGVTAVDLDSNGECAVVNGALECWNEQGLSSPKYHIDIPKTAPAVVIPDGVTAVAVGFFHRCAIVRGALWCRGQNREGEIGNGRQGSFVDEPVRVIDSSVTAVAVTNGFSHTCAIAHGALLCWGYNDNGWIDPAHPGTRVLPPRSRTGEPARHAKQDDLENQSASNDVLTPKVMIASGVTAIAEGAFGNLCVVVDAKLRCRGLQRNPQVLGWPDLYTGSLPFDIGIGDIDAIDADTPARLALQEKQALDSLVPKLAKALQGALISDGQNVFKVFHVDVQLNHDRIYPAIRPQLDTIPLYRILHDGDAALPVGGTVLGFRAEISKDASCGDANDVDGRYAKNAWNSGVFAGFYIQTGDYFALAGDALHSVTPLSPLLFRDWPASVAFSPKTAIAKSGVFREINACADAVMRDWSRQPFTAISIGGDDGTSVGPVDSSNTGASNANSWKTDASPRFGGVWYDYSGGDANSVVVTPKSYATPADFSVDVRAVGMPLCRYEAQPWKLTRNGSHFTLPDWARDRMDVENYGPIHHCGPIIWGDKFTIYYRSKPIEQLYVANPRSPDGHTGEPPNQALRLASYAGVTVQPKYAVSKPWPGDPSRTIVALALPEKNVGDTDNEDAQSFALELLVMKTDSDEVLQRYHEDGAFASDAMMFDGIALDTANYAVKPGARAFGLRASYSHNGYASSDMTTLQLFLTEGRRLEPLTRSFVVSSDSADRGTGCDSNGWQMQRIVAVATTRTHGHADLVVRETSTETIAEDCKKAPSAPQTMRHVLRFDGREYPVPGDWVE